MPLICKEGRGPRLGGTSAEFHDDFALCFALLSTQPHHHTYPGTCLRFTSTPAPAPAPVSNLQFQLYLYLQIRSSPRPLCVRSRPRVLRGGGLRTQKCQSIEPSIDWNDAPPSSLASSWSVAKALGVASPLFFFPPLLLSSLVASSVTSPFKTRRDINPRELRRCGCGCGNKGRARGSCSNPPSSSSACILCLPCRRYWQIMGQHTRGIASISLKSRDAASRR